MVHTYNRILLSYKKNEIMPLQQHGSLGFGIRGGWRGWSPCAQAQGAQAAPGLQPSSALQGGLSLRLCFLSAKWCPVRDPRPTVQAAWSLELGPGGRLVLPCRWAVPLCAFLTYKSGPSGQQGRHLVGAAGNTSTVGGASGTALGLSVSRWNCG